MTSTAHVSDQDPGARVIRNNQHSRSVAGFIESGATIVHSQGVKLEVAPLFVPFPTMFGVLDLPSGGTVRVSCLVSEFTPGDAAGVAFRLMALSVDSIG